MCFLTRSKNAKLSSLLPLEVVEGGIGRGKLGTSVGDTGGNSGPALGCSILARFEGEDPLADESSERLFLCVLRAMVAMVGVVKGQKISQRYESKSKSNGTRSKLKHGTDHRSTKNGGKNMGKELSGRRAQ